MKIDIGPNENAFVVSLEALLRSVPTCDHEDRRGCDSFDTARGDHLCFHKATVSHPVENPGQKGTSWYNTTRKYCDRHKQDGDKDLPFALAYRSLLAVVESAAKGSIP